MPLILKKLSSRRRSSEKEKKTKSRRIFGKKSTSPSSEQHHRPYLTSSSSEGSSSFDSEQYPAILPTFSVSSLESTESPLESQIDSQIDPLKRCHLKEVQRMSSEISKLRETNNALRLEKETSEYVMLQQETEIMEKDKEIQRLNDALLAETRKKGKKKEEWGENKLDPIPATNDGDGNKLERERGTAENVIQQQEIEIATKADEILFLRNALKAQQRTHDSEATLLVTKLVARAEEIEALQERLTAMNKLVTSTANMMLGQQKEILAKAQFEYYEQQEP